MAPEASIHAPAGAAEQQRLFWAQRRRAAAAVEAEHAKGRLRAAEEQLREARQAVRACRAPQSAGEMVGLGYFADEVAAGREAA
jgi:hypothetical protein